MANLKQFKLISSQTGNEFVIRIEGEMPKTDIYFVLPYNYGAWICTLRYDRAEGCFNTNFEGNLFLETEPKTISIMGKPANKDGTGEAYVGEAMTAWSSLSALGHTIES